MPATVAWCFPQKHLAHMETQSSWSRARQGMGICIPGHCQYRGTTSSERVSSSFSDQKMWVLLLQKYGLDLPLSSNNNLPPVCHSKWQHLAASGQLLAKYMQNIFVEFTHGALFNVQSLKSSPDAQTSPLVCRSTGWSPLWHCPLQKEVSTPRAGVWLCVCTLGDVCGTIIFSPNPEQWVVTDVRPKSIGRKEIVYKSMTMTGSLKKEVCIVLSRKHSEEGCNLVPG